MEPTIVEDRDDFAKWAFARANAILVSEGSNLATAARSGDETALQTSANALGQAIVDALMDVFDELTEEQ